MSLIEELGAVLLAMSDEELAAYVTTLDAEDLDAVQAALNTADVDSFIAGRHYDEVRRDAEHDGALWLKTLFPNYARYGFAPHMQQFWEWVWAIERGASVSPFIAAWFRGAAKSTGGEAACIALGARRRRRYGLYVSDTSDQADEHVGNIGHMLESPRFGALYPDMASRSIGQYGTSRGWSRKRLHTASGFVIDALGLRENARGIRVDEDRPDLIVFDDIDSEDDGPLQTERKIGWISEKLLPACTPDVAVMGLQNLIHPNSIFARLCGVSDEPIDMLTDRIVSGPVPAVDDLDIEPKPGGGYIVRGGTPRWEGYGLDKVQSSIDKFGLTAFMKECQHAVSAKPGGMFSELVYQHCTQDEVPPLIVRSCWVDPAVTSNDGSDCQGIQVDGLAADGAIYRLWSWEARVGPRGALGRAIRMACAFGCPIVGVETDQGGDTWQSVFREACADVRKGDKAKGIEPYTGPLPGFRWEKAGQSRQSKQHRASQMLADYERGGRIIHVLGSHEILEAALHRFPKTKPFDLVDAAYWSWWYLQKRRPALGNKRPGRTIARARLPQERFTS